MREFYSDISLWLLIPWMILSFLLAFYFYRNQPWLRGQRKSVKISLLSLRFIGLFLLGLLLWGILWRGSSNEIESPLIITLVDDSESMLNYKDSSEVKDLVYNFTKSLKEDISQSVDNLFYTLDGSVQNIDSVDFIKNKTDLGGVLETIYNRYYGRNIGAIVLVSDGNYNTGVSPAILAKKFKNIPFYTLGVGDTIQKTDHLIKSIIANEVAFIDNKFPVEITIEGNKTPNQVFDIKIYEDDKLLDKQQLIHQNDDYSLVKTIFYLTASEVGIHEYSVQIEKLSSEHTYSNNVQTFFVEVIENQSKVLFISESLNPDLGVIKRAVDKENNLEIIAVNSNEIPESLASYDLIIWDSPGVNTSPNDFQKIIRSKVPKWYLLTPQTSISVMQNIDIQTRFEVKNSIDEIRSSYNSGFNLFKLSTEEQSFLENLPPVKTKYGTVKYEQNSSLLLFQKVGNIVKKDPLFYFGKNEQGKFAVTYGIGMWGWSLADYRENRNHSKFNSIISKTIQYLILKENTTRLHISLPSIAETEQEFEIGATFYNDSYEKITDPDIQFELTNDKNEKFNYYFHSEIDNYSLHLGKLQKGRYSWIANTEHNGKYYEKKGSFAIESKSLEKKDTKANHQILQQIASNSEGEFRSIADYKEIVEQINNREDLLPILYESTAFKKLLDYLPLLLVILLAFSLEWLLRRFLGSY